MKMKTWRCWKILKVESSSINKSVELMMLKLLPATEGSLLLYVHDLGRKRCKFNHGASTLASWNLKRDKWSATTFDFPGICFALNKILKERPERNQATHQANKNFIFAGLLVNDFNNSHIVRKEENFVGFFLKLWPYNSNANNLIRFVFI